MKLTWANPARVSLALGILLCSYMLGPASAQPLDHFMCYKIAAAKGAAKFQPVLSLPLEDRFETGNFDVKKPAVLCVPSEKNGEEIFDRDTHLEGYKLKAQKGAPKHEPQSDFRVVTQFGELILTTVKPDRLLVPTAKSLSAPVEEPPNPDDHDVDHFKCYKIKKPKGFPAIEGVAVEDQFGQPKLFDFKKPDRLCVPVDKNGEGQQSTSPQAPHLVCFKAKPQKGEPKHVRVAGIHLRNQFGAEQVDTKKEESFCVPTTAVQGCGDGLINEPDEECDDGNNEDGDGCSAGCQAELPLVIGLVNFNILQDISAGDVGFDDLPDRLILLAEQLALVQPDIITLQEVVLGPSGGPTRLVNDLQARFGLTYIRAEYGVATGNAVLSKWPVTLKEVVRLPSEETVPVFSDRRFAARVEVASPIGPIDVYAMHFCAGSIGCTMSERTVQAQEFLAFVQETHISGHPAIVGADFNAHTGSAPDADPNNDPPIDVFQGAGWVSLFDGFDAPCNSPADRSGCTSGIEDLTMLNDTTTRRIDNIMTVPASASGPAGVISEVSEIGPTRRFGDTPFTDPHPECHFDPRIPCQNDSDCPAGAECNRNDFCVLTESVACVSDDDCASDPAPQFCRDVLWISDHVGVQSVIEIRRLP